MGIVGLDAAVVAGYFVSSLSCRGGFWLVVMVPEAWLFFLSRSSTRLLYVRNGR